MYRVEIITTQVIFKYHKAVLSCYCPSTKKTCNYYLKVNRAILDTMLYIGLLIQNTSSQYSKRKITLSLSWLGTPQSQKLDTANKNHLYQTNKVRMSQLFPK
jgi:hypothetical protein